MSTYYCSWTLGGAEFISNLWTLEVVSPFDIQRVHIIKLLVASAFKVLSRLH